MKTLSNIAKALLLVVVVALSLTLSAQSTSDKQKFHINIIKEENGNKEVIDRDFATKAEMDAFIKENKLDVPELPTLPMLADSSFSPMQQGNKKSKKIIIIEKEEGNTGGKTDLDIAFENFSATERAQLIQEMLDKKDSKVEIKQVHANANSAKEKITVVEREEGATGTTAELNIDYSNFSPTERATLIQEMLDVKDSKVEIKQLRDATAASEKDPAPGTTGITNLSAVKNLQLFPNPNNGQFHISFNTKKPADVQLRMTDMGGREVYSEIVKCNNEIFNKDVTLPTAISAGSYVLEAVCNGQKITTQVVVQ